MPWCRKEDPRMREGRAKRRREEKQKNRFGESGGPFLCASCMHVRLLRVLRALRQCFSIFFRSCDIPSLSFILIIFVLIGKKVYTAQLEICHVIFLIFYFLHEIFEQYHLIFWTIAGGQHWEPLLGQPFKVQNPTCVSGVEGKEPRREGCHELSPRFTHRIIQ